MENIAGEEINGVVILKPIDDNGRPYKVVYQDLNIKCWNKYNRIYSWIKQIILKELRILRSIYGIV